MSRLEDAAIAAWHQERAARQNPRHGFAEHPSIHDPRLRRQSEALVADIVSTLDPALVKRLKAKIKAAREANLAKQ